MDDVNYNPEGQAPQLDVLERELLCKSFGLLMDPINNSGQHFSPMFSV